MIEGKVTEEKGYEKDGFSVRWTVENGLGLVFVVCLACVWIMANTSIGRVPCFIAFNVYPKLSFKDEAALSLSLPAVPSIAR